MFNNAMFKLFWTIFSLDYAPVSKQKAFFFLHGPYENFV